jgi:hypothetical protein
MLHPGQLADRVSRISRGSQDSNLKSGNSILVMENSPNTKSLVMKNSATTKSRVTQHSGKMEHRVRQNSESKNSKVRKDITPSRRSAPRFCLRGITKMQKHRLQKIHQRELAKKEEEERN